MSKLKSLSDLKQYVLEQLGAPVIKIEIEDGQLESRMNDAIEFFMERHYDGTEAVTYTHYVTAEDAACQYIVTPTNLSAVIDVQMGTGSISRAGVSIPGFGLVLPDMSYEIQQGSLSAFSGAGAMTSYYIRSGYINLMRDLLVPHDDYEYTPATHGLYLRGRTLVEGDALFINGYITVDPENYVDIYNERFIKKYSTALAKKQWGNNLKKYDGVNLVGGIQMNGQRIYDEAVLEIEKLEEEFQEMYEFPAFMSVG